MRYFNVAGADLKKRTGLISNPDNLIKVVCEVALNKKKKLQKFIFIKSMINHIEKKINVVKEFEQDLDKLKKIYEIFNLVKFSSPYKKLSNKLLAKNLNKNFDYARLYEEI